VAATAGAGVDAAANAAPDGAAAALAAVRDGGRLVTITSDPPDTERGIDIVELYVRADGEQLSAAGRDLAAGRLDFELAATFPLAEADGALARSIAGGVVALEV
jgi:NADPH:quinone reductase-like Zn-dependent oxidoreductase